MSDQANGIEALLESVSEGRRVDWDAAERSTDSAAPGRIRALRQVARIAEFSRDAQRAGSYSVAGGYRPTTEPRRWGSLLLLELLGAGASGEVWRAWDPQLEREVALKLLQVDGGAALPADLSPLLDEGRALARVQHPNVVTVHGVETHGGRVGLRLEFVRGTSLEQEILRRGALPPAEVARMGASLARALAAVHAAGLVHRDVKPANVVLEPQGRLVLTDFGLGQRRFAAGDDATRVTGTPMFMSPERLAGAAATERDDLYGAGVTLWCALAGRHPFDARTLGALKSAVRGGPTEPLSGLRPDLPPALVRAVERAMAPEAASRFASANELADALEAASAAPRVAPRRPLARWVPAAAVLAIAATALVWTFSRPRRDGAPAPAASAPVAAAPEQAAYTVSAALVRHGEGGVQRLSNGDRVRPGDRLSLEFRASQAAYVYVLNEDERGESYLLFPQPLFDQANPVPAGATVTLPGTIGGAANAWTVTSRGGREHFLVVTSPEPVPDLEAELSRLPAPRAGRAVQYAAVPPAAVERLRGVGGVTPLPAGDTVKRAGAFEHFRTLAEAETNVRGTWVRQITLENPLR
jgi:hypothetical protein